MKPKISIITICYNSEATLERTIKSVLSQDYENIEYIIIDGASADGTVDIIRRYADRIAYWSSEPDNGISDAFNKGIQIASGDIIGIVNSDDEYMPNALKFVADAYTPGIDVYRGSILIHDALQGVEYTYEPSMEFRILPIHVNVCHLPTFITKNAYKKYGTYSTDFKLAMDLDLLRRFYRKGAIFKKIDAVLGRFNVGGISTQAGITRGFEERKKVIMNNGGSIVHVLIYDFFLILSSILKKLFSLLRFNYLKFRYKD